MDYYERKHRCSGSALRICWWCLIGIMATLLLSAALSSCTTTKYVEVEKVRHDTTYVTRIQRDSVLKHDSIFVKEWMKGDTVFRDRDRWHIEYRDREVHDTLYKSRVDSIPKPYPVEKLVEKNLSWWQKTQMYAGDLLFLLLIGLGVWWFIRLKTS